MVCTIVQSSYAIVSTSASLRIVSASCSQMPVGVRTCLSQALLALQWESLLGLASGLVGGGAETFAGGVGGEEGTEHGLEEGAEDHLGASVQENEWSACEVWIIESMFRRRLTGSAAEPCT